MNTNNKEFHHIVRPADHDASFRGQLAEVLDKIGELTEGKRLFFVRFFISDAANQQESLLSAIREKGIAEASVIQQPPLDGSKVSAWIWTIDGDPDPSYVHEATYGMTAGSAGSLCQMGDIFSGYGEHLANEGMNVADNCVRTWIFVRDVDTNYAGVVAGRRNYFDTIGLVPDTHYIASTGIQGSHSDWHKVVVMDAYAVKGLQPDQIRYLQAKEYLNPTYEYGVTFERGTAISYGDRKHVFISGTASIDNKGMILHEGDVRMQTLRMMENISALLAEAGSGINDIKSSILYLRDAADYAVVSRLFRERWPMLDPVFVQAPVCRTGWLVEMECVAVSLESNPGYRPFLIPSQE